MIRGNLATFLPSSHNLGFHFRHAAAADKRTPEDYEGVGGQETHDGRVIMRRVFGADGIERASGEWTDGRERMTVVALRQKSRPTYRVSPKNDGIDTAQQD